jgi:hypothetical protein
MEGVFILMVSISDGTFHELAQFHHVDIWSWRAITLGAWW